MRMNSCLTSLNPRSERFQVAIFSLGVNGHILKLPPRFAASGRPLRSWKAPLTRSLERLRYVAHAFQRAGSGGFPAARWWYCHDAPSEWSEKRLECVRFIGAFRPAREGQRVLAAMHEFGLVDALHESERRTPVPRGVVCPAVQYRAAQESGAPIWILIIGVSLVV